MSDPTTPGLAASPDSAEVDVVVIGAGASGLSGRLGDRPLPAQRAGGRLGASAFHCPSCDGYEARDKDIVVLGWSQELVGFATQMLNWSRSVVLVTDGRRFEGDDTCRTLLDQHDTELVGGGGCCPAG